jgi:hypothetical protein
VLGAIVQKVPLSIGLAIFIGPLVSASTSHAEKQAWLLDQALDVKREIGTGLIRPLVI